jgi:hypothetical protein
MKNKPLLLTSIIVVGVIGFPALYFFGPGQGLKPSKYAGHYRKSFN